MSDVYYIIVTSIFGAFVLIMLVGVIWYMRKPHRKTLDPEVTTFEDLSDDQKAMIYKYCNQRKKRPSSATRSSVRDKSRRKKKK